MILLITFRRLKNVKIKNECFQKHLVLIFLFRFFVTVVINCAEFSVIHILHVHVHTRVVFSFDISLTWWFVIEKKEKRRWKKRKEEKGNCLL